jgi:pimeloyl-ACP methyl ester carboxylesterase
MGEMKVEPRPDRRQTEPPFQATSDGVAYRVFGQGTPLVLLHGGAGNWQHWVLSVDALSARFRVIALDLPSYGDSETIPWETEVTPYLVRVARALEEMVEDAAAVHFAGFSFGGFIAADMAVRFGARTASLSMTGGAGYGRPEGRGFTLDSRRRLEARLGRAPSEAELRAMHAENLGKLMLWDRAKIDDWAIDMQKRNVERTRFDSRKLSWSDGTPDRLRGLDCPVLVAYGDHDAAAVPPIAERLARCRAAKSDVETRIIPDCGHWAMYEKPDETNAMLLDFHGRGP